MKNNEIPTKEEVQDAVRLILKYAGEDPTREGLLDTPKRVVNAYETLFEGYKKDINKILDKRFLIHTSDNSIVLLKDIVFSSLCEHHMLPFSGKIDVAYIPDDYIIGVSKIVRLVEVFARRLQVQERMMINIAESLQYHLNPKGVAVKISAVHSCMSMRGVNKHNSIMCTTHFTKIFGEDSNLKQSFFQMLT